MAPAMHLKPALKKKEPLRFHRYIFFQVGTEFSNS